MEKIKSFISKAQLLWARDRKVIFVTTIVVAIVMAIIL